jgi:hypothetical protein
MANSLSFAFNLGVVVAQVKRSFCLLLRYWV